jgi:muramidase (phage lysozyme)
MASIDQTGIRGKTRDKPISAKLEALLLKAAGTAGVDIVYITSGGQPGSSGMSIGSRHNGGNAADLRLIKDGRTLTFSDEKADPIVEAFVVSAAENGAIGIGAGVDYMGSDTLHVGFGERPGDDRHFVWGARGHRINAPPWLKAAADRGWKHTQETPVAVQKDLHRNEIPPLAISILDFVGPWESGHDSYNSIFGNRQKFITKKLTSMTCGEVRALQQRLLAQKSRSTAVGRYQFLLNTLESLKSDLGVDDKSLFSSALQDKLALRLLQQCGYEEFISRKRSLGSFALRLARVWASLPVLETVTTKSGVKRRGESYYQSSLNRALAGC